MKVTFVMPDSDHVAPIVVVTNPDLILSNRTLHSHRCTHLVCAYSQSSTQRHTYTRLIAISLLSDSLHTIPGFMWIEKHTHRTCLTKCSSSAALDHNEQPVMTHSFGARGRVSGSGQGSFLLMTVNAARPRVTQQTILKKGAVPTDKEAHRFHTCWTGTSM